MAKPVTQLTSTQIKNAKPTDKLQKLFDGGGLYLEIKPSGVKTWRMKCKPNGKETLLSFGQYPMVSLADARKKRAEAQKQLSEGLDPRKVKAEKALKAKAQTEYTFEKIARNWYKNRLSNWKENTAKDILNQLEQAQPSLTKHSNLSRYIFC